MMQVYDTNLDGAIERVAAYLNYPADKLHEFAAYAPFQKMGWDNGQGSAPVGSLFSVEGRILYVLVRAMQPNRVLELGTNVGASTTHIAAALTENGKGTVDTVDNKLQLSGDWQVGQLIPQSVGDAVNLITTEGLGFVRQVKPNAYPFIFEDMLHGPAEVEAVWTEALRILPPGGVIVSHDAAHFLVGAGVRAGIQAALAKAGMAEREPLVLKVAPGDTGLAVWLKPGGVFGGEYENEAQVKEEEPAWPTIQKPSSAPAEAKKPTPRRRRNLKASQ
jgi:predicted O-methyltransferase YrrM